MILKVEYNKNYDLTISAHVYVYRHEDYPIPTIFCKDTYYNGDIAVDPRENGYTSISMNSAYVDLEEGVKNVLEQVRKLITSYRELEVPEDYKVVI